MTKRGDLESSSSIWSRTSSSCEFLSCSSNVLPSCSGNCSSTWPERSWETTVVPACVKPSTTSPDATCAYIVEDSTPPTPGPNTDDPSMPGQTPSFCNATCRLKEQRRPRKSFGSTLNELATAAATAIREHHIVARERNHLRSGPTPILNPRTVVGCLPFMLFRL